MNRSCCSSQTRFVQGGQPGIATKRFDRLRNLRFMHEAGKSAAASFLPATATHAHLLPSRQTRPSCQPHRQGFKSRSQHGQDLRVKILKGVTIPSDL